MAAASVQPARREDNRFRRRRLGPRGRPGALAVALIGVTLLAGACGGGGKPAAVAQVGGKAGTSTTNAQAVQSTASPADYQKAVQYSQCMRKNGVPGFPDPNAEGDFVFQRTTASSDSVNPSSVQFQSAQKACKSLAPNRSQNPGQTASFMDQGLKFSECMRTNGVPGFPDPKEGNGGVFMSAGGLDTNSPQFQKAMQACRSLMPGGGPAAP
jgi:hypothetical protein